MSIQHSIAYFSMEIALAPAIPTYSGGLGVLAGDTLRAAADLDLPMVGVTLLHRKGYLSQHLDTTGWQTESPAEWPIADVLTELPERASIRLEGRTVWIRAWRGDVVGITGAKIPVYFLDTDVPENTPADRTLTHYLYGGDQRYRLCQEAVLGIGGVRVLRVLGHHDVGRYHMNEGHAALLGLELLQEEAASQGRQAITREDVEAVRRCCVFTTHTPVPAGHDKFPLALVDEVLPPRKFAADVDWRGVACHEGLLNLTYMALSLSHYINGVAKRHAEVSQHLFAGYRIDAITNGVHAATWTSPQIGALFDRHMPDWRKDSFSLRYALSLPRDEVWQAHCQAKQQLLDHVRERTGIVMKPEVLTIGFARRATSYKRADLVFRDPSRLRRIARELGPIQFVFAGKAHPSDLEGKREIQRIYQAASNLSDCIPIAYLQNYDMRLGQLMTAGADVWLNTPEPPMEASGTSGMKAALNGVPSLSVLDGWWIEGCIEGVTGWAIGEDGAAQGRIADHSGDAGLLYEKLEAAVLPAFYKDRERFLDMMVHAMALNGSFFNTHRMILQYVQKAYFN